MDMYDDNRYEDVFTYYLSFTKDYVLGKFTKEELDLINPIIDKMPNIIEDYLKLPFDNVMNKYN